MLLQGCSSPYMFCEKQWIQAIASGSSSPWTPSGSSCSPPRRALGENLAITWGRPYSHLPTGRQVARCWLTLPGWGITSSSWTFSPAGNCYWAGRISPATTAVYEPAGAHRGWRGNMAMHGPRRWQWLWSAGRLSFCGASVRILVALEHSWPHWPSCSHRLPLLVRWEGAGTVGPLQGHVGRGLQDGAFLSTFTF